MGVGGKNVGGRTERIRMEDCDSDTHERCVCERIRRIGMRQHEEDWIRDST